MKKFYSIIVLTLVFGISLFGQTRIYPPNLRAPENNAEEQNPNVYLDWDAVTGQTGDITYEVQVASLPDFSDAFTYPRTDLTALEMSELIFGNTYYWRVKAFDGEEPSNWSETWSFSVIGSVSMTKPILNATGNVSVLLEWKPITGLSQYQIQIDTSYEWKPMPEAASIEINGTFVLAADNMWLVGKGGLIQHYDGSTWTIMDAGITADLNGIYMVDSANGYIVGNAGTVLHYNGTEWSAIDAGVTNNLNDIRFVDENNGWIVGDNKTILKYADGTWSAETNPATGNLTGVFALGTSNVWACGTNKEVLHFDGSEWTAEVVGIRDHNDIWFVDENNGWVVSKVGKIHHYNGSGWIEQKSGTNKDVISVCFVGMHGYAVASTGIMLNYLGGWREASSETTQTLNSISVINGSGIAAGANGEVIIKTSDGFNSPYLRTLSVNHDSTEFEIHNLLYGETIYFRMRGMHGTDTTDWSGGRSFITRSSPSLTSPSNGSANMNLFELFTWGSIAGSTDYLFQIDVNEDFSDPFSSSSDSVSTNYQMRIFGQTYYWRVQAMHAVDESDFSDIWSLTTVDEVTLVSPVDGEDDVSLCPNYTWEEIVGVPHYEIWIDTDAGFDNPIQGITEEATYQCNQPLIENATYYWKVRAISTIDTSNWSSINSFTIQGPEGIGDGSFTSELVDIYPNPTDGDINLVINSYGNENYRVSIIDLTGKLIYEENLACKAGENNKKLQISDLQSGLYMITIRKDSQAVTKKLFVQ